MLQFILLTLFVSISHAYLVPRELLPRATSEVCNGPQAVSNNGDRKIALVIDSSGSMIYADPLDVRLEAGKSILDWLITKDEADSSKKQDVVTVVDFSGEAQLDYKLGDPANAYDAVAGISAFGDTYIAGGVEMAIEQLTADGTGSTADRSGIIVFTDGEDYDTDLLVNQINDAAGKGIRVSFGFLASSFTYQDPAVLRAIMDSGGRYFTISDAQSSHEFVNGILVNGLTKNDNPNGNRDILLAGLDAAHYIAKTETQTMSYYARKKEQLDFTIQTIDAGLLDVQIVSGSNVLAKEDSIIFSTTLSVDSPGEGNIDVKVTAHGAPDKSIFVVGVLSNLPPRNCTVGVGGGGGKKKNTAAIVGPTVGIGSLALLLGSGYFLYKYWWHKKPKPGIPGTHNLPAAGDGKPGAHVTATPVPPGPPPSSNWLKDWFKFPDHTPPAMSPPQKPNSQQPDERKMMDDEDGSEWEDCPDDDADPTQPQDAHNRKPHIKRVRIYGNNHHHHIAGNRTELLSHPCYTDTCPIASPDHVCDDPAHPCTCVDPKCKLNSRRHRCKDEEKTPPHKCPGPKENPYCPLTDPEYAEVKKKEHSELVRKYMAQDMALSGVKMAAMHSVRTLAV